MRHKKAHSPTHVLSDIKGLLYLVEVQWYCNCFPRQMKIYDLESKMYTVLLRKRAHGQYTLLCAQTEGWVDICNIATKKCPV